MTVRRSHLILALSALAAAVLYNLWFFVLRPGPSPEARPPQPEQPLLDLSGGWPASTSFGDPSTIPPPPAVDMSGQPSWRRDPFVFGNETRDALRPSSRQTRAAEPVVSSILYSASRRLAIVDGRIVGVGDAVGNYRIVEIERDAVVLAVPSGARIRVSMHGSAVKGRER